MKTLFNKITKNVILPLVLTAGIYNIGFSQTKTDSLIKFNLENKQVYEDFVNLIKEHGEKSDKEISYLKIIKEAEGNKIFSANLNSGENPKLVQLGFFKIGYGRKFLDNYPWGLEGKDMYSKSNLRKSDGKFNTQDQSEMIKNLLKKEQLSVAKEYTETLKQIMHEEKYKNY